MKNNDPMWGKLKCIFGIGLFIVDIIVSLYWLIESIIEKAGFKQYIGVFLLFIFLGFFATACYLDGKRILRKNK